MNNEKLAFVATLLVWASVPAHAFDFALECQTDEGFKWEMKVDLTEREIVRIDRTTETELTIVDFDDTMILADNSFFHSFGEFKLINGGSFLMNRRSGRFWMTSVTYSCPAEPCGNTEAKFISWAGFCSRQF